MVRHTHKRVYVCPTPEAEIAFLFTSEEHSKLPFLHSPERRLGPHTCITMVKNARVNFVCFHQLFGFGIIAF